MIGKEDPAPVTQLLPDTLRYPEAVRDPERHRLAERDESPRGIFEIRLERALQFQEGLGVEGGVVELLRREAARFEAIARGAPGKLRVVLLAGEALFLRGGDDPSVHEEAGGRVVVVGREA